MDSNQWKGITMKKAQEQGIQTAKLPIGNYLMSISQVPFGLTTSVAQTWLMKTSSCCMMLEELYWQIILPLSNCANSNTYRLVFIFYFCLQVLNENQVMEILLKFLETRDGKASFFRVISQRKKM